MTPDGRPRTPGEWADSVEIPTGCDEPCSDAAYLLRRRIAFAILDAEAAERAKWVGRCRLLMAVLAGRSIDLPPEWDEIARAVEQAGRTAERVRENRAKAEERGEL